MTLNSLIKQVLVICPDALFETNDDGEIIIESGFRRCKGHRELIELVGEEAA